MRWLEADALPAALPMAYFHSFHYEYPSHQQHKHLQLICLRFLNRAL
jgi:hypothetical protein